jgi:GAF domain-containing protein
LDKHKERPSSAYPLKKIRLPISDAGVAGIVAKSATAILLNDPRKDKRVDVATISAETGLHVIDSLLFAPILSGSGEVLAVVRVINKSLRDFNAHDIELLDAQSRFGKEVSFILENARRVKESLEAKNYA